MKTYLYGQQLWGFVESDVPADFSTLGQTEVLDWYKKNALALHAIQISCTHEAFVVIKGITSAKAAWAALDNSFRWKPSDTSAAAGRYLIQSDIDRFCIGLFESGN